MWAPPTSWEPPQHTAVGDPETPLHEFSLLPQVDATVRCAPHAREHAYDPGGTAIGASTLLVATLPGPWPKPALAHPKRSETRLLELQRQASALDAAAHIMRSLGAHQHRGFGDRNGFGRNVGGLSCRLDQRTEVVEVVGGVGREERPVEHAVIAQQPHLLIALGRQRSQDACRAEGRRGRGRR